MKTPASGTRIRNHIRTLRFGVPLEQVFHYRD